MIPNPQPTSDIREELPCLMVSPLTDKVYIVTKLEANGSAKEKFDVTDWITAYANKLAERRGDEAVENLLDSVDRSDDFIDWNGQGVIFRGELLALKSKEINDDSRTA